MGCRSTRAKRGRVRTVHGDWEVAGGTTAGELVGVGGGAPTVLVHLTTPATAEVIRATGRLGRVGSRNGIYAIPSSRVSSSAATMMWRTGLTPSRTGALIEIPSRATPAFSRPIPIGPFTTWARLQRHHITPAGHINLSTGEFIRSGANMSQVQIYATDAAITTIGGGGGSEILGGIVKQEIDMNLERLLMRVTACAIVVGGALAVVSWIGGNRTGNDASALAQRRSAMG